MADLDERRDTARKTMLLEKTRPFEIQGYQETNIKRSFWQRFKGSISLRRCFNRTKAHHTTTKVFVSEEQRTFSKVYDKCFFMSTERNSIVYSGTKKSSWRTKLQAWDRTHPPYQPQLIGLMCWQFLMLIVLWFHLFEIPLVIFFGEVVYTSEFDNDWSLGFNYFTIVALVFDSLIKLNTAYYREGLVVLSRRKIVRRYFRLSFWLDVISLAVLIVYIAMDSYKFAYLKLLFYLKCYDIWHYDNQIQKGIELNVVLLSIYRLFRVIIIFVIYSHWMACGFFYIDYYLYNNNPFYYNNNYLWLYYSAALPGLDMVATYSWYVWYEYALYWALQTATTVGYGDITPKNPPEVLYTIINMIAMCVMFAYFINSVWEIIGDLNQKSAKYKNNFNVLNRFLDNKNVSSGLRQKLRAYLDYLWRQDTVEEVEELVISKLTPTLRDELAVDIKYPFFLKIRLFNILSEISSHLNEYQVIKKELAHSLQEQRYSQGEMIFECAQQDFRLFYVLDGKIRIGFRDLESKGIISTAENFGQYEFVTQQARLTEAVAVHYSHVFYLDRQTFLASVSKFPELKELFLKIREEVKINRKFSSINLQCFNCFEDHSFVQCPSLHYIPNRRQRHEFIGKTEQQRDNNYRRYAFRESKMLLPVSQYQPIHFEKVCSYDLYYPESNIRKGEF